MRTLSLFLIALLIPWTAMAGESSATFSVSVTVVVPSKPIVTQGNGTAATPAQVAAAIPNITMGRAFEISQESAAATGKKPVVTKSLYQTVIVTY